MALGTLALENSSVKEDALEVIQTLQPGGRALAVVRVIKYETGRAVLKDFSRSSWLFRRSLGRLLAAREARAYRRLEGVPGVPRLLRRISPDGLLLEYIPGTNSMRATAGSFSTTFFDEASTLLAEIRARGVLHCDVGGNLLLGTDGRPYLVDFASSVVLPQKLGPVCSYLQRLRGEYDRRALLKIKRRRAPHLLRPAELEQSRAALPLEGWARIGEKVVRRTVGWLAG